MRFFGLNKDAPLGKFPVDGNWSVAQATYDGRPMLIRVNADAKRYRGHAGLPFRLGVAVPLRRPDASGMPAAAESAILDAVEDALCDALQPSTSGFLVAVVTGGGMREFVFYCQSPATADAAVDAARAAAPKHELQHYVEPDPKWDGFTQFL